MAKLVVTSGDIGFDEFEFEGRVLIGRDPDCDLTIARAFISRRHAAIDCADGRYFIEDLGSSNGTVLNGSTVQLAELHEQDAILLGDCQLVFLLNDSSFLGGPEVELDESSTRIVASAEVGATQADLLELAHSMQDAKLMRNLRALQEVSETCCGALEIGTLLERVLRQLLQVYPQADHVHAVLLGFAGSDGDLRRSASRAGLSHTRVGMSRTLLEIATTQRKALLAGDVESDPRLKAAESVVDLGLRSIMCGPLVVGDLALGAIQVDTTTANRPFNEDDLLLLVTIAGEVAVATENARLHREIVAQHRLAAIGQTISSVAHCIKNVLNNVRGGAHIVDLGFKKEDAERVTQGWDIVKRNNDFMFDVVTDMLAYCGRSSPRREMADIGGLLRDTVRMAEESALQKGVELQLHVPGQLPKLEVDATGMKRVMLNLLANAVEACPHGSHVNVAAAVDEAANRLRITVEDDGPGMADDVKRHLFEPFFTTKGSRGTGLGLSLVKKIVEEHHGCVEVESEVGQGTAFHIWMPTAAQRPETSLLV